MTYLLFTVLALWVACYVMACKANAKKKPSKWADVITLATVILQYVIAVLVVLAILF